MTGGKFLRVGVVHVLQCSHRGGIDLDVGVTRVRVPGERGQKSVDCHPKRHITQTLTPYFGPFLSCVAVPTLSAQTMDPKSDAATRAQVLTLLQNRFCPLKFPEIQATLRVAFLKFLRQYEKGGMILLRILRFSCRMLKMSHIQAGQKSVH